MVFSWRIWKRRPFSRRNNSEKLFWARATLRGLRMSVMEKYDMYIWASFFRYQSGFFLSTPFVGWPSLRAKKGAGGGYQSMHDTRPPTAIQGQLEPGRQRPKQSRGRERSRSRNTQKQTQLIKWLQHLGKQKGQVSNASHGAVNWLKMFAHWLQMVLHGKMSRKKPNGVTSPGASSPQSECRKETQTSTKKHPLNFVILVQHILTEPLWWDTRIEAILV